MNGIRERKLREALLEIEWASRRRPTKDNLAQINALARAALRGVEAARTADAPAAARRTTPEHVLAARRVGA